MSSKEIKAHRKQLPEGHIREQNVARHVGPGWDPVDETDGSVAVDVLGKEKQAPQFYGPGNTETPRQVADEIYGMIWKWARSSPETFALMAQIVRHNEPDAYGHLSDDELATKIEQHAKDAARKATETVYKDKNWDRGNVIGAS